MTWVGEYTDGEPNNGDALEWVSLDADVNSSIAGQSKGYPIGYIPTIFVLGPVVP